MNEWMNVLDYSDAITDAVFVQREVVSSKNFDPLLAPVNSSVNIRRPTSLGDNNGLLTTTAVNGERSLYR